MMLKHRLSKIAVTAAALIGTMAMVAPVSASAATYRVYQLPCANGTVNTAAKANTWFGGQYVYRVVRFVQPTHTAPTQTWTPAPTRQAPVLPAPTSKAPVLPAPTAKPQPAPQPPKAQPTTPATQPSTAGLTAAEQQMLNLVNAERSKAGLPALKADLQLTKLARLKSQDMINRNYFSHQSPTYGSPFDQMKNNGVTYRTAGENIAGNQSVQAAHTALMNSAGHRANILNSQFTHVGIGIVTGGQYGMMFTQQFVGR